MTVGDFVNALGNATNTVDNALKAVISSGNQSGKSLMQTLIDQSANQSGQSLAAPIQQQVPVEQIAPQQASLNQAAIDIVNSLKEESDEKSEKSKRSKNEETFGRVLQGIRNNAAKADFKSLTTQPAGAEEYAQDGEGDEIKPDVTKEGSSKAAEKDTKVAEKDEESSNASVKINPMTGQPMMVYTPKVDSDDSDGDDVSAKKEPEKKTPGKEAPVGEDYKEFLETPPGYTGYNPAGYTTPNRFRDILSQQTEPKGFEGAEVNFDFTPMTEDQREEYYQNMFDDPIAQRAYNFGSFINRYNLDDPAIDYLYDLASDLVVDESMDELSFPNLRTQGDITREEALGIALIHDLGVKNQDEARELLKIAQLAGANDQIELGLDPDTRTKINEIVQGQVERDNERESKRRNNITDEQQAALEDEMRAMSEAQAFLLENPGATNGSYELARLMSQGGQNGKYAQAYGLDAVDLETMSDTDLILNELANNEDYRNRIVESYGNAWDIDSPELANEMRTNQLLENPFLSIYLNGDDTSSDKLAMTKDLFLGEGMDPVVRAQLLQRVYNQNMADGNDVDRLGDILRRDFRGEELSEADMDYLAQNIMDNYFANPIDVQQWDLTPGNSYAKENPLNYADQVAWMGDFASRHPQISATLQDLGIDRNDLMAYVAAGNQLNLGDMWRDRQNGALSPYWFDYMSQLANNAGYKPMFELGIAGRDDKEAKELRKRFRDTGQSRDMSTFLQAIMDNLGNKDAIMNALEIGGNADDQYNYTFNNLAYDLLSDYQDLGDSRYVHPIYPEHSERSE